MAIPASSWKTSQDEASIRTRKSESSHSSLAKLPDGLTNYKFFPKTSPSLTSLFQLIPPCLFAPSPSPYSSLLHQPRLSQLGFLLVVLKPPRVALVIPRAHFVPTNRPTVDLSQARAPRARNPFVFRLASKTLSRVLIKSRQERSSPGLTVIPPLPIGIVIPALIMRRHS